MKVKIKPLQRSGGYFTVFDNSLLDVIMPACKPNTWKIICVAIRKTIGWHKDSDVISLSQFQELTGIGSRPTVLLAIKDAEAMGILIRTPDKESGSFSYCINRDFEIEVEMASLETKLPKHNTSLETKLAGSLETKHTKESSLNIDLKQNLSDWPDTISPWVNKITELWKITPPQKPKRKKSGEYFDWIKEIGELSAACGEFGEGLLDEVIKDYLGNLRSGRPPYIVSRPGSLIKVCRAKAGILRQQGRKLSTDDKQAGLDFMENLNKKRNRLEA